VEGGGNWVVKFPKCGDVKNDAEIVVSSNIADPSKNVSVNPKHFVELPSIPFPPPTLLPISTRDVGNIFAI